LIDEGICDQAHGEGPPDVWRDNAPEKCADATNKD